MASQTKTNLLTTRRHLLRGKEGGERGKEGEEDEEG